MSDCRWGKPAFDILIREIRAKEVIPNEAKAISHNGSEYPAYFREPAMAGSARGVMFRFQVKIIEDAPEGVPAYVDVWSPIWLKAALLTNNEDLSKVRLVCFESPDMAAGMASFINACVDTVALRPSLRVYPQDQLTLAGNQLTGRRIDPHWDKPEILEDAYLLLRPALPVTRV